MPLFHWINRWVAADISIDLGTANTLVYMKGQGIIINEPSIVAVREGPMGRPQVIAVGQEAKRLLGRTPAGITTVRPLREGVIADFDMTKAMLEYFVTKAQQHRYFSKPVVVVSLPHDVTYVERRAVNDAGYAVGARRMHLIHEPMAAALGADLPVLEPVGSMVVDIGGGTSEVAVVSLAGIVCCHSVRIGGDAMDAGIVEAIRRKHNLLIGERTAERLKIELGTAWIDAEQHTAAVKGRDLPTGQPRTATVASEDVRDAISAPLRAIVETIKAALEETPPELAGDIAEKGIVVTGGGALIRNIDRLLRHETGLPIRIDDRALLSVALGGGKALENPELLEAISLD